MPGVGIPAKNSAKWETKCENILLLGKEIGICQVFLVFEYLFEEDSSWKTKLVNSLRSTEINALFKISHLWALHTEFEIFNVFMNGRTPIQKAARVSDLSTTGTVLWLAVYSICSTCICSWMSSAIRNNDSWKLLGIQDCHFLSNICTELCSASKLKSTVFNIWICLWSSSNSNWQ